MCAERERERERGGGGGGGIEAFPGWQLQLASVIITVGCQVEMWMDIFSRLAGNKYNNSFRIISLSIVWDLLFSQPLLGQKQTF